MAVIITNKQMPERCRDCFAFSAKLRYGCVFGCGQGSDPAAVYSKRHDDCVLEDFPDVHGDLIDKYQLIEAFDKSCRHNTHRSAQAKRMHAQEHWNLFKLLQNQPVVVKRRP